ncbi:MAG: cupredoxin family copper-binding protein [Phycisphaerales bacterium]|nr:cupredoxin family copper-binding protein [Phycisphaerales bacterium]
MKQKSLLVAAGLMLGGVGLYLAVGAARVHSVSIADMSFTPAALTIAVDDTVVWTNRDERDHNVVSTDGTFKSGNLSAGGTYSYRFSRSGKYEYGCSYHPREKGTIVVSGQ